MHIFHAYCAILLQFTLDARMVSLLRYAQATLTCITMKEIFSSSNSTNPTPFTMKNLLFLIIIIKEIANSTKIPRKLNSTLVTVLRGWLLIPTLVALHQLHRLPVELMILFRVHLLVIFDIIMAQSTWPKLFAFRALLLAPSFVVLTAKFRVCSGLLLLLLLNLV